MRRSVSKMFVSYLPAVTVAIGVASAKALRAAADVGRNKVVTNLSGTRSGHVYKVPDSKNTYYTASAPGEFPAIPTGRLKGSVRILPSGGDLLIGTDLEYGLALEKKPGNKGGRPWLKRSLDQAKPAMLIEANKRWF